VLIHDDLLATGGSASAAAELVKMSGGEVAGFDFLVDLTFLNGKDRIAQYTDKIVTFVRF
jgi:adenine phosphoribosyltransferase